MKKNELPTKIEVDIFDIISDDELSEKVNEYLATKYGFCVNSYNYGCSIVISDIDWDTEE